MCFDKIMNNMERKRKDHISCPTCRMKYYGWENRVVKIVGKNEQKFKIIPMK